MVQINTRQFGDQLSDLPPIDSEQDNITLNPPNQPQDLLEDNNQLQGEEPNPPPEPEELEQFNPPPNQPNQPNQVQNLPVAMVQPQQLNWSYFKPEFSGKTRGRCRRAPSQDWMETTLFPRRSKGKKILFNPYGRG